MKPMIAALLTALVVLVAVPLSVAATKSSAVIPRGNVEVSISDWPQKFVLDQPTTVTLVVKNRSNIVMKNGVAIFSPTLRLVSAKPKCIPFDSDTLGGGCAWRISWLNPGKSVSKSLTLLFKSSDFPNATVPGTSSHTVYVFLQAFNRILKDRTSEPAHLSMG